MMTESKRLNADFKSVGIHARYRILLGTYLFLNSTPFALRLSSLIFANIGVGPSVVS